MERVGMEICIIIRGRRWRWIWHILRMENNKHVRAALTWTPEGKRKRGRPKENWNRAKRTKMQIMGRRYERVLLDALCELTWNSKPITLERIKQMKRETDANKLLHILIFLRYERKLKVKTNMYMYLHLHETFGSPMNPRLHLHFYAPAIKWQGGI